MEVNWKSGEDIRNVSTNVMTITVSVQKDRSAGAVGEAEIYNKPVNAGQESAPSVPGSIRSSGFIGGTFAGSLDQVIQITVGNSQT